MNLVSEYLMILVTSSARVEPEIPAYPFWNPRVALSVCCFNILTQNNIWIISSNRRLNWDSNDTNYPDVCAICINSLEFCKSSPSSLSRVFSPFFRSSCRNFSNKCNIFITCSILCSTTNICRLIVSS